MTNQIEKYSDILTKFIVEYDIELTREQIEKIIRYMFKILDLTEKVNLTSIKDPEEFIEKHLLDSLLALPYIKKEDQKIIDVGTGGGFPGVPLAIALPKDHFILLDSTKKKLMMVEEAVKSLGITNVTCVHARAEDASHFPAYRDSYDYVISRAVAPLQILSELCLPFLKPDGTFLAFKGKQYQDEVDDSLDIVKKLNGEISSIEEFQLIPSQSTRVIIKMQKKGKTPENYPRSFSAMKKSLKK